MFLVVHTVRYRMDNLFTALVVYIILVIFCMTFL